MAKTIRKTANHFSLRTSALAVASTLFFAAAPWATAEAAGLGKIKVFSALGQPLRAEVEVFASREELAGMTAKLAAPAEFKQAGVDYASTLLGISFVVSKSQNGQAIIKLTSERPISDPFVDLLLELNWPSGRLIRDYTFLLDPPEFAARAAAAPAPALVARPVASARSVSEARALAARPAARAESPRPTPAPAAVATTSTRYEVRRGDTLSKIARETRPAGVSLDQMLVGLFRANEDAFDRGNMNRLRAGKILTIPEQGTLESLGSDEAARIVVAQSSDWGAYRRKLAAAAADAGAVEEPARQQAAGKITTRVEDHATPAAEARDQLKVSKGEAAGKAATTSARSDEDLIAKEKALRDANERLASLEKNVAELQRLVELKSQSLADLEKQSVAKAPPAAHAGDMPAAASAPPAANPADKPPAPPLVDAKPAEVAQPEQKSDEAKAEVRTEEAKPAEAPRPVAKPKEPVLVAPEAEEPGFLEELLSSTTALAGGGAIVALLAAYALARRRRQGEERSLESSSTLVPQSDSLVANSVFRSTGGQTVDTSHSMAQSDFSQAGPGSIDTDEVDPVAEADVYMAYGRDAQAEEILLEARQKDPGRYAIHLKLLEIYLGRKDAKPFDALATDLFNATGGVGADWEKAAAMGLQLDARNPLYGAGQEAEPALPADEPPALAAEEATFFVERKAPPAPLGDATELWVDTVTKPGELSRLAQVAAVAGAAKAEAASDAATDGSADVGVTASHDPSDLADLDFDLGAGENRQAPPPVANESFLETTLSFPNTSAGDALDFDFATSLPQAETPSSADSDPDAAVDIDAADDSAPIAVDDASVAEETMLIGSSLHASPSPSEVSFDFDLGSDEPGDPSAETQAISLSDPDELLDIGSATFDSLEFDVTLTESTVLGQGMQNPLFDLSSLSLDLDEAAASDGAVPADSDSLSADFEIDEEDTMVNPDFSLHAEPTDSTLSAAFATDMDLTPESEITSSEEVATKIDLATAYQEMGDLEGARELLQEVLKDGDTAQRETALAILGKLRE